MQGFNPHPAIRWAIFTISILGIGYIMYMYAHAPKSCP